MEIGNPSSSEHRQTATTLPDRPSWYGGPIAVPLQERHCRLTGKAFSLNFRLFGP